MSPRHSFMMFKVKGCHDGREHLCVLTKVYSVQQGHQSSRGQVDERQNHVCAPIFEICLSSFPPESARHRAGGGSGRVRTCLCSGRSSSCHAYADSPLPLSRMRLYASARKSGCMRRHAFPDNSIHTSTQIFSCKEGQILTVTFFNVSSGMVSCDFLHQYQAYLTSLYSHTMLSFMVSGSDVSVSTDMHYAISRISIRDLFIYSLQYKIPLYLEALKSPHVISYICFRDWFNPCKLCTMRIRGVLKH